jgi:hypothetical protein
MIIKPHNQILGRVEALTAATVQRLVLVEETLIAIDMKSHLSPSILVDLVGKAMTGLTISVLEGGRILVAEVIRTVTGEVKIISLQIASHVDLEEEDVVVVVEMEAHKDLEATKVKTRGLVEIGATEIWRLLK